MLEYVFIIVILIKGRWVFVICFNLYSFCSLLCAPRLLFRLYLFVLFLYSVHSFQPININTLTAAGEPPVDPRRVNIHNISVQLFYSAYFDSGA